MVRGTVAENISVRRFVRLAAATGQVASYVHGRKIGVLVEMNGGDEALGRDIAMHIAASRPECVSREQVSAELIAKEKEIFIAQAAESGKPPEIIEKMVTGRINKYLGEITLLGQPFVKDPETTVEKLLAAHQVPGAALVPTTSAGMAVAGVVAVESRLATRLTVVVATGAANDWPRTISVTPLVGLPLISS